MRIRGEGEQQRARERVALLRGMPEEGRPLRAALIASMVLFGSGGLIGFAIEGNNVKIPAHYHGCTVGVTLALMGLGGLIAVIGGLMFLVIAINAMRSGWKSSTSR